MEHVVQQLRAQIEALNGQLAQTAQETEQLRQQAFQAQLKANDAGAKADLLANRLQSVERTVSDSGGGGKRGGKEVNVVDIKTLKPSIFKGTSSENFQHGLRKPRTDRKSVVRERVSVLV